MKPYYEDSRAGITIYLADSRALLPWIAQQYVVDLVLADPPYGKKEKTNRKEKGRSNRWECRDFPPVAGDDEPFDPQPALNLKTKTILWGANYYADKLPPSPSWLVWDKRDGIGPNDNADFEMGWSNLGGPARIFRHVWSGVIRASENGERVRHPTQKPTALFRWCLTRANLKPGALVLDPYMGSGPIAQACKEMGYRYIGVELVEEYCEIAVRRLQQEVLELF